MSEMSSDEYKLSARTIPEVDEALKRMVLLVKRDKAVRLSKQDGTQKKPTQAAILSAIVLWVDALEREEQRRVIAGGMAILNRWLDGRDMPEDTPRRKGSPVSEERDPWTGRPTVPPSPKVSPPAPKRKRNG